MLNRIQIQGRLVRDPILRQTHTGKPVANFTLACERDFKDAQGNTPTDFIDVVAWGPIGEFVNRWFTKGQMVLVDGRLEMRGWTDKNGNKRVGAEINAANVYFAGSRSEESGRRGDWMRDVPAPEPDGHQYRDLNAIQAEEMDQSRIPF